MKTYIHIDSMNLFFRSVHTINPNAGVDAMAGLALHTIFSSMRKVWNKFSGDHIVYHMEGRSWRKDTYPKYKLNRKIALLSKTEREKENDEILFEAYSDLCEFIETKTNVTALRCGVAEADDTIAIFIQQHPEDKHIIISSDSDFVQMLKHDNVYLFNGITDVLMSKDGLTDDKGRNLAFEIKSDSKLKVGKPDPNFKPDPLWYDFVMFLKQIRGDKSDNIFSAFPGARLKGTKNNIGIREAYEDREERGFKWNNFMLQRWVDEEDQERLVKTQFELNQHLIDLEKQPDEIREACIEVIQTAIDKEPVPQVGIHFMRYCGKWDLNRLSNSAQEFANILNSRP